MKKIINRIGKWLYDAMLAVPVRTKVVGVGLLPILILGFSLNYWITTGLSDWLSYILADVRVQAAMAAGARSVFFVTILGAITSILFSLLLAFILSRPILSLKEMAQQVASGHLDARAPVWGRDEIGELAVSINTMTDHLVSTQEDLARKNRGLAAINQIVMAAEQQNDIHDALYIILGIMVSLLHLRIGWIYLLDPERHVHHLASWYGVSNELMPHMLTALDGSACECQDIYLEGNTNLSIQTRKCKRLEHLAKFGFGDEHFVIPLVARDQQFGTINLLVEKDVEISADDMELLASIGSQIAEIVANAWLQIKLTEKEAARQALLESLVNAQEEERARLARELHDGAGQTLTSLLVRLKALEKKTPEHQKDLETMQTLVSETIQQVRDLAYHLRPVELDEFGLSRALEILVDDMTRGTNLKYSCQCTNDQQLIPQEVQVVLYRIAQEGLTNILRHAQASCISLTLRLDNKKVAMIIEDDGMGFDPSSLSIRAGERHLGLVSMRERAEILGGTLDVYTAPGEGTSIQVSVPVQMQ